jgi:hypothetical protein
MSYANKTAVPVFPVSQEYTRLPAPIRTLHYFLPRGRMASLSVPEDITPAEIERLRRHLELDLLDEEEVAL